MIHVTCNHTTWNYNIKHKHTYLILPLGHLGIFQKLPWLKISSIPWFASFLMSSHNHLMNSKVGFPDKTLATFLDPWTLSWGFLQKNLRILYIPIWHMFPFCMMSLVLDDFIFFFNVQWPSQDLYPSFLYTMGFSLHDSRGDVSSSCF